MFARWFAVAGLLLTLLLPIYPEGLSGAIIVFGALAGVAGLAGLVTRRSRLDLLLLAPWAVAVFVAFTVGAGNGTEPRQAFEDALPFGLFALGLLAGRGTDAPRHVLVAALLMCVAECLVSLWKLPAVGPGIRSTYFYFKITAGLPLVGIYLASVLRRTPLRRRSRWLHVLVVAILWIGLLATVSRGMILAAALGLLVAAYLRRPSIALLWLAGIAALGVAASSSLVDLGARWLRIDQAATVEGRVREIHAAFGEFASAPLFGKGLGARIWVEGQPVSFVHNLVAYHLWKFGLVGCLLLLAPLLWFVARLRSVRPDLRAAALGATVAIAGYLVTSAAYKTYYLVWTLGVVMGASATWFEVVGRWTRLRGLARKRPGPEARTDASALAPSVRHLRVAR